LFFDVPDVFSPMKTVFAGAKNQGKGSSPFPSTTHRNAMRATPKLEERRRASASAKATAGQDGLAGQPIEYDGLGK
jgi:hypothetical protein